MMTLKSYLEFGAGWFSAPDVAAALVTVGVNK